MSVLPYVQRVLEIYAVGDEDYLSMQLVLGHDDKSLASPRKIEKESVSLGTILARGRMQPENLSCDIEESKMQSFERVVQKLHEVYETYYPSVPDKADLIEVGVLNLIVGKLQDGKNRLAGLDALSVKLPKELEHLEPVFSEAHFNYILGNRAAVMAMCGALIESAAKHFAPDELFIARGIKGEDITFRRRIGEMQEKGLLEPDRKQCALDIWERRGYAVHADPRFPLYSDVMIEKTLIDTRNIVEELFQ